MERRKSRKAAVDFCVSSAEVFRIASQFHGTALQFKETTSQFDETALQF